MQAEGDLRDIVDMDAQETGPAQSGGEPKSKELDPFEESLPVIWPEKDKEVPYFSRKEYIVSRNPASGRVVRALQIGHWTSDMDTHYDTDAMVRDAWHVNYTSGWEQKGYFIEEITLGPEQSRLLDPVVNDLEEMTNHDIMDYMPEDDEDDWENRQDNLWS